MLILPVHALCLLCEGLHVEVMVWHYNSGVQALQERAGVRTFFLASSLSAEGTGSMMVMAWARRRASTAMLSRSRSLSSCSLPKCTLPFLWSMRICSGHTLTFTHTLLCLFRGHLHLLSSMLKDLRLQLQLHLVSRSKCHTCSKDREVRSLEW